MPPLPWIDCKSLVDSWQETKFTKEARFAQQDALQKCFGGGGVPPIPGSGNPGGPGDGGGPPLPPGSEPPECDTGDPEIDDTADLREQLMQLSLDYDRIEYGGLIWPDDNGGYEFLEYGVDIPGGSAQPCRINSPPASSFPDAGAWPEGVIFFHTHPYAPGDSACGGIYRAGASPGDRAHLGWLRANFNDSVEGMVMDEVSIYRYGETTNQDQPTVQRCK